MRSQLLIVGGVALGILGVLWYVKSKLPAVGAALNPVNPDNVFATGANSVVASVTQDPNETLGGWLYDLTHSDPLASK